MKKMLLPGSDIEISPIAFGAWAIGGWLWGGSDDHDALLALETGIDIGMTSIDTAPVYGFGLSETLVGKAIKDKRNKVQIFTKFGLRWDRVSPLLHTETKDSKGNPVKIYRLARKEAIIEECEQSLKRLATDYIDYYQIHWPDTSTPVAESMEALQILKEHGKIRAGGVCNFSLSQLKEALDTFPVSCNQVPYSMLERNIENDLMPWCNEHTPKIIAYSPLQRGVLTGKIRSSHSFNEGDHRAGSTYFKDPNLSVINTFIDTCLGPIASNKGCTIAQLVLKWTLLQNGVCCVLAGARNKKQVLENGDAVKVTISNEECVRIREGIGQMEQNLER